MKKLFFLFSIFVTGSLFAQVPDWSQNIAPIIYGKCASCHHSGGIAPFTLMSYSDAFAVSPYIYTDINNGKMPPWPPDPSYRHLAHERFLTSAEIDAINHWIANGTPEGNSSLAPSPPAFNNSVVLPGTPDLIVTIPTYTVTTATDMYRCFVVPSGLVAERYISAFEVVPGNRSIVHHVLVYQDTTGVCATLDAGDPLPGYTSFGGVGSNDAKLIGGWVPGSSPYPLPNGLGIRLEANADLVIQVHYPAGSGGQNDSTSVRLFFTPTNNVRNVSVDPVLNHSTNLINGPLFIPADSVKTFHEKLILPPVAFSLIGVGPHMHLLGQNIKSYAVTTSHDTIPLIKINNWDFHWQGFYEFQKVLKIPGNTTLFADAEYDNTSSNTFNPNYPPQDVSLGESTTDEMMLIYFFYMTYQPGDENIVIDTAAVFSDVPHPTIRIGNTVSLYNAFPNPASESTTIGFYLPKEAPVSFSLVDISGKTIRILSDNELTHAGLHSKTIALQHLSPGIYFIRMKAGSEECVKKISVN